MGLAHMTAAIERVVMLRITVSDEENKVRIIVEGDLSGDLAKVLEANWRKATATRDQKPRIVDLRGITFVDAPGKDVLGLMIDDGAEFVVSGPKTAYLIETLRTECRRRRMAREAGKLNVIAVILLLIVALMAVTTSRPHSSNLLRLNLHARQIMRSVS
jgi:anti-anti-sigma regulatory factor